jgi:hypothetical protein
LACVLGLASITPGCSLLYDLSADQCAVAADCQKLDGALAICRAGVCVEDDSVGGSGGSGGSAPDSGAAGKAGAPSPTECTTNVECIDSNFGQPFICSAGKCVGLVTDECPLVIGTQNLRVPQPIIFGAYANAPDSVSRSSVVRNLELVVAEFTRKVTGLRGGPGGTSRALSFVVCNSSFPGATPGTIEAFEPSLDHLVDELAVPGIVAALQPRDLQAVFSQRLNAAGTFVISPYDQDSELASLSDKGRLWHMLGATADLAPVFGPLLKRTDTFLRLDDSFLNLSEPGAKLRVAIVTANVAQATDVRDAMVKLPELADFEVQPFQIESALLNPEPDVSGVSVQLFAYRPHIIVALAGSEFIESVFPALETGNVWFDKTAMQQRPMYVLGSTMAPQTWSLYSAKQSDPGSNGFKTLLDRIVGVSYASAEDPKLLDLYEQRLFEENDDLIDPSVLLGSESVYDAGYLLVYATAAAGEVPTLTGKDIATGMRRLIGGSGYDIGPADISRVLTALDNGDDVGLNLTLGVPNWNEARGTRNGVGSVYCLNNGAFSLEASFPVGPHPDALRYDPETNELEDTPFPCIPKF